MRSSILSLTLVVAAACSPVPFGSSTDDQPLLSGPTVVAPTSGFGDPSRTVDSQGNVFWTLPWYVPLPVSAGDVIGTVTTIVRDNGAANGHSSDGNNVLVNLISRVQTSDPANPIDTSRAFWGSNGSGNQQTATLTPIGGYTVQAGDEMLVVFSGLKGGALPGPSTVPSMTGAVMVGPAVGPSGALGSLTINIPVSPNQFAVQDGVYTIPYNSSNTGPNGGIGFAISGIPVGSVIAGVRVKLADAPGASVTLALISKEMAGDSAPVWISHGSAASSGTGAIQKVSISGMSYTVPAMTELALSLKANGVAVSPLKTYIAEIDLK